MLPSFIEAVKVSVTDTAVRLIAESSPGNAKKCVTILAPSTNAANVFIGGSGVDTTDGFPLEAGGSIDLWCDPRDIFVVVAVTASDVVNVIYS